MKPSADPSRGATTGRFSLGEGGGQAPQLGTFLGVFTPTLLTILGVIMYLRFGWVVGNVGLQGALVIVVMANAITLVTALSFSAIATNTRVGVGGAYFIISRSLGLEIGGAIGIPLYLSQVFAVTLYAYGLAETLRIVWAGIPVNVVAFMIIILVGALSLRGAAVALKLQLPVMVLVAASLIALAAGSLTGGPIAASEGLEAPAKQDDFWFVFAVFFPAVTGVMAGLGLSGDLKDPRKAIPLGSIAAALVGFVVYLAVVVLLALGADPEALRADQMIWTSIAVGGAFAVFPGLWGAIFSSAVGSMLGAPRTLQALVLDHASPSSTLGKLAGQDTQEPITGLLFSLILALGAVFLGGLNTVAMVVTIFFLTVYGVVNLVAALETLSGSATWRPKLNTPWPLSMTAGIACFAVMFLINWWASLAAILVEIVLWLLFKRWERSADWGDMRRDLYESLIRWALVRLRKRPMSARNWRPHILVFADELERRMELVRYGNWFSQKRGVVTVCELVQGDILDDRIDPAARRDRIDELLSEEGIVAFGEVDIVASIDRGIVDVVQANGLAGLESNTIMFGWPSPDRLAALLSVLRRLERLNKSLIIARLHGSMMPVQSRRRTVHIWWGGLQRNGDLMLLLAHLLVSNPQWRGAKVQVIGIASNETTRADTEAQLQQLLPETRIEAETRVIVKPKESTIREVIQAESQRADLVFLGLATPPQGGEEAYAARITELSDGLGTVFFVKNSGLFVGKLV